MFHLTRWQLCKLLIQIIFKRDFLAAARTLLSVLFLAHETVQTVAESEGQPQFKPRFVYDPIASRMVKRALAGLLVLTSVSSAWALGAVDVMDPITKLGKRLTGGDGIIISANTISASGTANAFANYTTIGRVTETTFANHTSALGTAAYTASTDYATFEQGVLAGTALQPGSIVNDLTTGGTTVPLSAEQGKTLQGSKQAALTGAASVEMNSSGSGDRNTYLDLHSDATNTDYSARIIRNGGVNGTLVLQNAGAGTVMVSGPVPKDLTSAQFTVDKIISSGGEYNGVRYGLLSQITLNSGYGDEPSSWTQYNPYGVHMYLNGEGSLQGYTGYGKITGAAPSPSTNAKDISGIGWVLESDVLNSMTTNELRIIRGDNSTGIGTGYSVARGLNIQMVKYDSDETTNFGFDANGACNSCGLWVWGGGGAFPTQRSYAGHAASGKLKYGADYSHQTDGDAVINLSGAATIGNVAIKLDATQTFTDGTVTKTLSQLAGGGSSNVSDATYDSSWNGDITNAPSKNAVYDKIETLSAGTGDVTGPASATDNAIALFNGTGGKTIKDSAKTIVTTLGTDDMTLPTSKAVKDVTDTKAPTASPAFTGAITSTPTWDANIVSNGDFSTSTSWAGANWTISGGKATHTAGSVATLVRSSLTVTAGKAYKITFDVADMTAGYFHATIGGRTSAQYFANGTYTVYITTAVSSTNMGIVPSSTFDGSIDNVVVQSATSYGVALGDITIDSAGSVGIGTTAPLGAALHIVKSTAPQVIIADNNTSATMGGAIALYHKNSTGVAPGATAERLGYLFMGGYDGTDYRNSALIGAYSESAWTASTSYPTYMAFEVTPSGATSRTERMRITAAGNVGIGTTAPEATLDINSATGGNLQLTYNDSNGSAANKVNFATSSSGDLTITPSGGDFTVSAALTATSIPSPGAIGGTTPSAITGTTITATGKLSSLSTGETVKANGTCSTSINIDPDLGGIHTLTLSGACAIGVTNLTAGESFTLKLTQSSTTAPTFTSAYKWPVGTAPTWSTSATKYDVLSCYSDDGTTLLCNGMVDVR